MNAVTVAIFGMPATLHELSIEPPLLEPERCTAEWPELPYRQAFVQSMADDGCSVAMVNTIHRLRTTTSNRAWKQLLDQTVKWNQQREQRAAQQSQQDQKGRAA